MFISKGTLTALAASAMVLGATAGAFAADPGTTKGTATPPVVNQGAAANSQGVPVQCADIKDAAQRAGCINDYQKNLKDSKSGAASQRGTMGK